MEAFLEISIILLLAALVSVLMKILKQPLIIGYVLSGIIIGPYALNVLHSTDTIEVFSKIGVTILLFIVGLSLSPKVAREVGAISFVTGVGQVVFTSLVGFFISLALGYSFVESLYISVALTFSSTIIILKLLSDKGDVGKLYGKISIGFLLVQDLIATVILIAISALAGSAGTPGIGVVFLTLIKGLSLTFIIISVGYKVLPLLSQFFAKSQELLFVFSLAWGLAMASLFYKLGFSVEIGALVAGVTLSVTPFAYEISSRMRPLRDFFIITFFILLGSQMVLDRLSGLAVPAAVFSLFIFIGNPLIVLVLMNLLGYTKRTGFLAGLTVAQISEFSLILVALGVSVGHLNKELLSMVTLVGLITISGSTYLILYAEKLYPFVSNFLSLFELKKVRVEEELESDTYEAILFGYHRVGKDFVESFKKLGVKFLIVDFDPAAIKTTEKEGLLAKYGDAEDLEFLQELSLSNVKLVASTMPDFDSNMFLVQEMRKVNKEAIIIVLSHNVEDSMKLYDSGASYVLMPHYLGARFASDLIASYGLDVSKFLEEKKRHIGYLKERGSTPFLATEKI